MVQSTDAAPVGPKDFIAAAEPGELVDENEFTEEDFESSNLDSSSTSITSSILEHSMENGRRVLLLQSFQSHVVGNG